MSADRSRYNHGWLKSVQSFLNVSNGNLATAAFKSFQTDLGGRGRGNLELIVSQRHSAQLTSDWLIDVIKALYRKRNADGLLTWL